MLANKVKLILCSKNEQVSMQYRFCSHEKKVLNSANISAHALPSNIFNAVIFVNTIVFSKKI